MADRVPPPPGPPPGYPPQQAYGQQPYGHGYGQPQYQQQYQYPPNQQTYTPPENDYNGSYKEDAPLFEDKFQVPKPKYNDLWAAALFVVTVFGVVAVSVLSIRGYANTRSVNGTGIYDDRRNTFGVSARMEWGEVGGEYADRK